MTEVHECLLTKRDMCLNKQLLCIRASEEEKYTRGNVYSISWVGSLGDIATLSSDTRPETWSTSSLTSGEVPIGNMKYMPVIFINAHKFSDEDIFMYKMSGNLDDLAIGLSGLIREN